MITRLLIVPTVALILIFGWVKPNARAEATAETGEQQFSVSAMRRAQVSGTATATASADKPKMDSKTILKGAKPIDGLIRTYRPGNRLIAELKRDDYNSEFIVLISIARGIGQQPLLGGMSWGFGDDWVLSFRKIDDRVHLIRRNVRFRATKNTPEARAVRNAYTDSVLFSLPILAQGPHRGDLIDLTPVFMSDLPQISQVLPGFTFAATKSVWEAVKGFDRNLEIEVAATYASSGRTRIDSVADTRGVTINVHYSISKIPKTDYKPRLADDRVGYFMTVVKDYSNSKDKEQFVRYVNRWNLKKADASGEKSVPKEPIIFWVEKTVPFKYRKPIHDGIAEWNKAFENAGFVNAIEVRQQPDDATWDPEDVNYNTFRWITANAGFAMGPSRVNPYTGQILDADIIFDADFLESWRSKYETLGPDTVSSLTGGSLDLESYRQSSKQSLARVPLEQRACILSQGMSLQLAFGSTALLAGGTSKVSAELREKLIMQGLKEVTMHEVGHTLGLRHNFKASTYLTLDQVNDPAKTTKDGLAASVMDYLPPNIVRAGQEQGDFYSTTIGPYDRWAIEYGYKQFSGGSEGERKELKKIAARSGEPSLAYATDENTRGIDPDPFSNRFDLGADPLEYARHQAALVQELLPKVAERLIEEGEDYSAARQAFNVLLAEHGRTMFFASRFVGGLEVSRSHKGDKDARPPIQIVDPKKQREALELLADQVFSDKPYQVDPELYSFLAPSQWSHWGVSSSLRPDFPVHDVIQMWQSRVLQQLLSSLTLERIHDAELKVAADQDALTVAELLDRLTESIFTELDQQEVGPHTARQPAVSSLRRNLQRNYLRMLSNLSLGRTSAPQDCQTVAYLKLAEVADRMDQAKQQLGLDIYTKAHFSASAERIRKVLDASLTLSTP